MGLSKTCQPGTKWRYRTVESSTKQPKWPSLFDTWMKRALLKSLQLNGLNPYGHFDFWLQYLYHYQWLVMFLGLIVLVSPSILFYSLFWMGPSLLIHRFLVQIPFMLIYFFGSTGQLQSRRDHPKHADQINDNTQQRNQAQNSTNGHHHLTPEWNGQCWGSFFCFSFLRFLVQSHKTIYDFCHSICINVITSLHCFFV